MKASSATATKSVQDARKKLHKFLLGCKRVPEEIIAEEAAKAYEQMVAMTPFKTGKLERSVYCRPSKSKRKVGIVAGASARNRGINYAGIQHENTSFKHPIKGTHHYISVPYNKAVGRIRYRVERELRDILK